MFTLKKLGFCAIFLPLFLSAALEETFAKERMYGDLETIKGIFEAQYAPSEWKQSFSGWSLDEEIKLAKSRVANALDLSIKDYQRIVRDFIKSTNDYHVTVSFYSTEAASLPFLIKSANHRYFIAALNRRLLPSGPLQVGDEVVSFNGIPIETAIQEFQWEEFGNGASLTDQALGEMFFTKRIGAYGHQVPKGDILLGVKHKSTNEEVFYPVQWNYVPEEIKTIPIIKSHALQARKAIPSDQFPKKIVKPLLNQNPVFKKSMLSPYYKTLGLDAQFTAGEGLGDKESFIPVLGKKIWSSHPRSQFQAYLFETPDQHRYGYIRIPHYDASSLEFNEFKELIGRLEMESEALIIDQLNNPGGSVFYMYALASVLSDKPLSVPVHRISITPKEVAFALEGLSEFDHIESDEEAMELIGEDLDGLVVTAPMAHQIADYFRFILNEWNEGISFTSPYALYGYDEIIPDVDVQYTKPILMLINHLDLSCGDFLPSILQDNKRAVLLGTKTAGAGGFVLKAEYPNIFGMESFSYTGSIAYRSNQLPLENLGVTPDIEYRLSEEDLTQFYAPFKKKILESIPK